jgi:SAM-dependent methyltransferase
MNEIAPLSHSVTTERVLALLDGLDWEQARVCDVGAGNGYFSQALGERLGGRGLDPGVHLAACDVVPEEFRYAPVRCTPIGADGRLPYDDASFDAVVSIEVVEHVENQFAFLREVARIAKPGARIVVTTPNTLNANSRLRSLAQGFPLLFDPLPLADGNVRHLSGHIHPISPYFLAVAALRAGLVEPRFHPDRTKTSAVIQTALLAPVLWLGGRRPTPPPAPQVARHLRAERRHPGRGERLGNADVPDGGVGSEEADEGRRMKDEAPKPSSLGLSSFILRPSPPGRPSTHASVITADSGSSFRIDRQMRSKAARRWRGVTLAKRTAVEVDEPRLDAGRGAADEDVLQIEVGVQRAGVVQAAHERGGGDAGRAALRGRRLLEEAPEVRGAPHLARDEGAAVDAGRVPPHGRAERLGRRHTRRRDLPPRCAARGTGARRIRSSGCG